MTPANDGVPVEPLPDDDKVFSPLHRDRKFCPKCEQWPPASPATCKYCGFNFNSDPPPIRGVLLKFLRFSTYGSPIIWILYLTVLADDAASSNRSLASFPVAFAAIAIPMSIVVASLFARRKRQFIPVAVGWYIAMILAGAIELAQGLDVVPSKKFLWFVTAVPYLWFSVRARATFIR